MNVLNVQKVEGECWRRTGCWRKIKLNGEAWWSQCTLHIWPYEIRPTPLKGKKV